MKLGPRVADRRSIAIGNLHGLRDGCVIEVRSLRAQDRDELVRGFEHLSPESRYRRFLAGIHHLSEETLRLLFDVDAVDHLALVAVDVDGDRESSGVGIARSIRDARDPELAEYAVVVLDAWQHRGVGKLLTQELAALAYRHGIRRWHATMLLENVAVRRLLEGVSSARISATQEGECLEAVFDLKPPP